MGKDRDVMGSAPWVHRRKHLCSENSLTGERCSTRNSLLSWGVCGMSRGGRGVRPEVFSAAAHPVLLPPPPQGISSAPGLLLLDESTFKVLACELGELG